MSFLDRLRPSPRRNGAQRMFASATLTTEALVVFFAVLVAHQLSPESRVLNWNWGLFTSVALIACSGMLSRGAWVYLAGIILQVPVILLGLEVPAMWVVGAGFAALYLYGVLKGHTLDQQKDAVDARWYAEHGDEDGAPPRG